MKKSLIILIVLFGVFLAIGCAGQQAPNETETPVQAVTGAEAVTGTEAVTPVQEVVTATEAVEETPVTEVTSAEVVTEAENVTGVENVTTHMSSTQRKKERILENIQAKNNTSGGGVIKVTPSKGS
ncbi:acidic integral membrane protein [Methanosarcina barkeri str. Wiesmoor]|uniref:Acidic integral membrane protein n=2 Tax=Methanosarcina barkeri TaxID=2208 RepID=A0A0E3QM88_METBA|nr:hypothetical protein [Methanosarcina barkeri]AKB51438.1 acidic integral membrane protein [Methanosarcina barkeri str. Wiesmoor]